jgi:hypothetical protein
MLTADEVSRAVASGLLSHQRRIDDGLHGESLSLRDQIALELPFGSDWLGPDIVHALTGERVPVPWLADTDEGRSPAAWAERLRLLAKAEATYRYMRADAMLLARAKKAGE